MHPLLCNQLDKADWTHITPAFRMQEQCEGNCLPSLPEDQHPHADSQHAKRSLATRLHESQLENIVATPTLLCAAPQLWADSVRRKRKKKMNKHKHRKRQKKLRHRS